MLLRYLTGVPMGYLDTYHRSFAQYKGPLSDPMVASSNASVSTDGG